MNWGAADFLIGFVLLAAAGLIIALAIKKVSPRYRAVVIVAVVALLALVWAEMAVGVFGSAIAGD